MTNFAALRRMYSGEALSPHPLVPPKPRSAEPEPVREPPVPTAPPIPSQSPVPTAAAKPDKSYIATPDAIIRAGKIARGELSAIAPADLKALQILAAGEVRRGEHAQEIPLPSDATARAIVMAGRKARNREVNN